MIDIYAKTLMNATRTGHVKVHDVPPSVPHEKRLNWFSRRKTRCIDPNKL